jgi:hypothetical protein
VTVLATTAEIVTTTASDETVVLIAQDGIVVMIEKPPRVAMRVVTRVGAEVGAATMTAVTHDVTEAAMEIFTAAVEDETDPAPVHPTVTIAPEMNVATAMTAHITEARTRTVRVVVGLQREMLLLS